MIKGIGVDIVEVERFNTWHTFSSKQLHKIFSNSEINYCLDNHLKSAERFAVRFAAKEAFYKAFSSYYPHNLTLLQISKYVEIIKNKEIPTLNIHWSMISNLLKVDIKPSQTFLSLSHTKNNAIAMVLITTLPLNNL